jgi:hypothetical protein
MIWVTIRFYNDSIAKLQRSSYFSELYSEILRNTMVRQVVRSWGSLKLGDAYRRAHDAILPVHWPCIFHNNPFYI